MLEISKYPVNVSNFTNLNIIIIMNDDMIKFLFEFNLEKTLGRRYPNGINWTKEIIHCFIEMLCSGTKFVEWQIASKYESPPILLIPWFIYEMNIINMRYIVKRYLYVDFFICFSSCF